MVYIRIYTAEGYCISLLTSKSKLAPLKTKSLPRLELCVAHLLADLGRRIRNLIRSTIEWTVFWPDSEAKLHWIKFHPAFLATFASSRVAEIQEFLKEPGDSWPVNQHLITDELRTLKVRKTADGLRAMVDRSDLLKTIDSCLSHARLLTVFANVFRFKKRERFENLPTVFKRKEAFDKIVEVIHQNEFKDDIYRVRKYNRTCSFTLMAGRLADTPFKFSMLLPKSPQFAKSYVRYHLSICRSGPRALGSLFMGNLPTDRLRALRPFSKCGVDFCGPMNTTFQMRLSRISHTLITSPPKLVNFK